MYDKFFLENSQLEEISHWLFKNEPLFILGNAGCGKTSLSKEILKDRVLTHIDLLFMKKNTDICEYIQNIVQKRNITMMFDQKKEKRGILIDDIDQFYKYDKKNYNLIIKFLSSYLCDTKIIITANIKFSKHRSLNKLKYSKIILKYDNHTMHKICKNICIENRINLKLTDKQKIIYNSSNNINVIKSSLLSFNNDIKINKLDNFDESEVLYNNIFTKNYSLKDFVRIYNSNRIKISLDLLENIYDIVEDLDLIKNIYNYYCISDIFETKCINYSSIKDYDIIFTIYNFNRIINKKKLKNNCFIPNKYISKSLIHVYSFKNKIRDDLIYFYLFLFNNKKYNVEIIKRLLSFNKFELDTFIKTFNYYYNSKIKYENIYKLLN